MRIDVELYGDIAEIVAVPSLLARIFGRRRETLTYAYRTPLGWCWDRSGRRVPDDIAGVLEALSKGATS